MLPKPRKFHKKTEVVNTVGENDEDDEVPRALQFMEINSASVYLKKPNYNKKSYLINYVNFSGVSPDYEGEEELTFLEDDEPQPWIYSKEECDTLMENMLSYTDEGCVGSENDVAEAMKDWNYMKTMSDDHIIRLEGELEYWNKEISLNKSPKRNLYSELRIMDVLEVSNFYKKALIWIDSKLRRLKPK